MLNPGRVRIASIAKVILFSRRKADMITVGKNVSQTMGGVGVRKMHRSLMVRRLLVNHVKGLKEFMFWAAFSYDKKCPCHIWDDETLEEKLAYKIDLDIRNVAWLDNDKVMWELNSGVECVGLRNKPGQKPKFTHTEATGVYIRRKGAGGINWYRYQTVIIRG